MITDLDKLLFLRVPRTGSTTIHRELNKFGMEEIRNPLDHFSIEDLLKLKGRRWLKNHQSFAVVRNPWDRAVSLYAHRKQSKVWRNRLKRVSFEEWIEKTLINHELGFTGPRVERLLPCTAFTHHAGYRYADHIIQYENLPTDLPKVIPAITTRPLDRLNSSDHPPYHECYNDASREMVAFVWRDDIRTFKYKFHPCPPKSTTNIPKS